MDDEGFTETEEITFIALVADALWDPLEQLVSDLGSMLTLQNFLQTLTAPIHPVNLLLDVVQKFVQNLQRVPSRIAFGLAANIAKRILDLRRDELSTRVVRADLALEDSVNFVVQEGLKIASFSTPIGLRIANAIKSKGRLFKLLFHPTLESILTEAMKRLFRVNILRLIIVCVDAVTAFASALGAIFVALLAIAIAQRKMKVLSQSKPQVRQKLTIARRVG